MTEQITDPTPSAPVGGGAPRMGAIVQDAYGSPDLLHLGVIDRPTPGSGEVLIRVEAAGLDRGTAHLMSGTPYVMRLFGVGLTRPRCRVPGIDVAGTVVAVGTGVSRLVVGDEVFGISRGSFAEYACASEAKLTRKPANLPFGAAAVLAVSGLTALLGVRDLGEVAAGQNVLIIGASGGVGTFAVQLAKATGAEVTGVASSAKADFVLSIGADRALDYARDDFADGSTHYDVIIDIAGNTPLSRLRRALTPKGTLVIVGGEEGGRWTGGIGRSLRAAALSLVVRQRLTMVVPKHRTADLEALAEMAGVGHLTPVIDRTFSLVEVPDAMRRLESGAVCGKLAISMIDRS